MSATERKQMKDASWWDGIHLSRQNSKDIMKFGAFSLVAGTVYKIAEVYLTQATNTENLDVMTDALQSNREVFNQFMQLQELQHIDSKNYHIAVQQADQLVLLDKQLTERNISPGIRDIPEASALFFGMDDALKRMLKSADAPSVKPRDAARLLRVYQKLYNAMLIHLKSVMYICRQHEQ